MENPKNLRDVLPGRVAYEIVVLVFWIGAIFSIFHYTMLPTLGFYGDTPRFQTTPAIWGLNNPPGSPLQIFFGRFFLLFPVGDVAYRINLMSLAFGCLVLVILYLLLRTLKLQSWEALLVVSLFGFSKFFWEQSIAAEIYTTHLAFILVVTFCLWHWSKVKNVRWLIIGLLIYAVGFGNHLGMLLLLPSITWWLLLNEWQLFTKGWFLFFLVCIIFIGSSQFLYVWWYGQENSFYGAPTNWSEFIDFITGSSFKSLMQIPSAELLWLKLRYVLKFVLQQVYVWGIVLILLGVWDAIHHRKRVAIYLILFSLTNLVFSLLYEITDPEVYLLPFVLGLIPFLGLGLQMVFRFVNNYPHMVLKSMFYLLSFLLLSIVPLYVAYPLVNLRGITMAQDWSSDFVNALEPGSLVYAGTINRWDVLAYALKVAHPDVEAELIGIADQAKVVEENFGIKPIYVAGNDYWLTSNFILDPPPPPHIASVFRKVPAGSIVILSVYDDASLTLDDATIQAFNHAGITGDLRGHYRMAHLAIGVQGAPHGTALELMGDGVLFRSVKAGEEIGETGVISPVGISVRSASLRRGIGGQIWIDGQNISPGVRGYNVVVLSPEGEILYVFSRDLAVGPNVDGLQKFKIVGRWHEGNIEIADKQSIDAWLVPEDNLILFSEWDARRYLGKGWGLTEDWGIWAVEKEATLYMYVKSQNYELIIEAMPYAIPDKRQSIQIFWNDIDIGKQSFKSDNVEELKFYVPTEVITDGVNKIRLIFDYAVSPEETTQGESLDSRTLAVWLINLRLQPTLDH